MDDVTAAVQAWSDLYASSAPVATAVAFLHLGGLLVAGGFSLAFDRATLRLPVRLDDHARFMAELEAVHRPVLFALWVVVISGAALLLADLAALLPSPVFWLKMSLFALLLLNGAALRRAAMRVAMVAETTRQRHALRRGSLRTIALWISVLFLGVLLTSA